MEERTSLLAERNPYSNNWLTNTLEDSTAKLTIVLGDGIVEEGYKPAKEYIGNGIKRRNDKSENTGMEIRLMNSNKQKLKHW